jgi:predicted Zn-dependent peptidase
MVMMMPSASFQNEHRHAASALASILGGGDGSRLHWAIVDSGLAESAAASADASDKFGEQCAWAVCDPKNAEEVADRMRNEMKSLVTSLTQEDLTKVIAKAGTAAAVSSERPAGRMQRLGSTMTTSGQYCSVEDELQSIENITLKDLQNVAELFPWEPIFEATTVHSA